MYLVTGGAGFIGSHIAERLLREGQRVRIIDDLSTGSRDNLAHLESVAGASEGSLEIHEADVTDAKAARRACEGTEVAFHLAAIPSVPRSVDDPVGSNHANVNGTLSLLEAARAEGVRRVVYSASSSAYGDVAGGASTPKREDMRPNPLSPYAVAKLTGEYYVRVYAKVYELETVCLRYFNIFGPRQSPFSPYGAAIPKFASALVEGKAPMVFGDGEQSRDFTYVDNAVDANLLAARAAAEKVSGEVVNVACGESATLIDVIARLNRILGTNIAPEHAPPRAGDVRHSLADVSRARELLGYEPKVSLDEGLERMVAWIRDLNPS